MIFNSSTVYAKVWKVEKSEKYIDLTISTSEKDQDENVKYSRWFPRCIGHAFQSLKDVAEGDRIVITKSKFTNECYEDKEGNKRNYFKFLIMEAEKQNDGEKSAENKPSTESENKAPAKEEDWPF